MVVEIGGLRVGVYRNGPSGGKTLSEVDTRALGEEGRRGGVKDQKYSRNKARSPKSFMEEKKSRRVRGPEVQRATGGNGMRLGETEWGGKAASFSGGLGRKGGKKR